MTNRIRMFKHAKLAARYGRRHFRFQGQYWSTATFLDEVWAYAQPRWGCSEVWGRADTGL